MVIGFISLFTPSYPSCAQAKDAMENARLDRAGPTFVPFLVGYNANLKSWLYEDSNSPSFIKLRDKAQSSNVGVAEERPCWTYCKSVNATAPERDFISRLLVFSRDLKDERLLCPLVLDSNLRDSLICFDYRWNNQEDCDDSIFVSLSSTQFILRGILVVFAVLPVVVIYKRLLRCTEDDTQPCIGHFFAYPFILIVFVICFILAWVLAISLQGEVVGDFTISFLFSFLLSLLFEFPKLGLFYMLWKGKRLERLWLETQDGAVKDGVIVIDTDSSSSGVEVLDLEAFNANLSDCSEDAYTSRAAPVFQSPYADAPPGGGYSAPPGAPYGAPPVYSPYASSQPPVGYGAPPPGHPYGYP